MGAGSEELGRVQKSPACMPLCTPLNRSRFSQTASPGAAVNRSHRPGHWEAPPDGNGAPGSAWGQRDQEERFQGADGCQCAQAGVVAIGKRTVHCSWGWILFHPLG